MRWPYILSLIALLGASLLLFFNILCGATTHAPLNKWYWLQADTSSIPGANSVTRWTNYASCGVSGGKNTDCSSKTAAYPMSPVSNFGTTQGVPSGLSSKHGVTYYLSKVGWAFLLIGLLFTLLALLPVLISFCMPSMSILNVGTGIATTTALLFTALSAALLTACYVKARNAFKDNGNSASLGKTMLAFIWTSVFLLALSSLFSGVGCLGNFMGQRKKRQSDNYDSSSHDTYGNDYTTEKDQQKRGLFGKKKNTRTDDLEDVGYAAGLGASGATSDYTKTRGVSGTGAGTGVGTGQTAGTGSGTGAGYSAGATAAGVTAAGVLAGSSRDPNTGHLKTSTKESTGENIEGVGYAAGLGASGATSDVNKGHGTNTVSDQNLDDVAYAAGIGASGATSDVTKGHGTNATSGQTLDDVAYAAGFGASGATSDYTKKNSGYGTAPAGNDYGSSAGTATTNTHGSSGYGKTAAAAGVAGAGLGSAIGSGNNKGAQNQSTRGTSGTTGNTSSTGETVDDVAKSTGYGSAGATSKYTGAGSAGIASEGSGKVYSSKDYAGADDYNRTATGAHVPASKPYDTDAAIGNDGSAQSKGLWASAAAALGLGGAAATTSSGHGGQDPIVDTELRDNRYDTNDTKFDPENTDVGRGSTRAGLNAVQEEEHGNTYENKSTVLPVGGKHVTSDSYGNQTAGYETGVPEGSARSAATASAAGIAAGGATAVGSSKGAYKPVKVGAATNAEDTYNSSNVGMGKTHKDLTSTSGYEPTSYYSRKTGEVGSEKAYGTSFGTAGVDSAGTNVVAGTHSSTKDPKTGEKLEDVAYAAGLGASGATSGYTQTSANTTGQGDHTKEKASTAGSSSRGTGTATAAVVGATGLGSAGLASGNKNSSLKTSTGQQKFSATDPSRGETSKTLDPRTGEKLNDVAYAAGFGASGATSDVTKKRETKGSKTGEKLDDVSYAAGLGASGATSEVTQTRAESDTKRKSGISGWFGGKNKRDSTASSVYADDTEIVGQTGNQTSYDTNSGRYGTASAIGAVVATGAAIAGTSDTTKRGTTSVRDSSTRGPDEETMNDVGYAAGLGASGATSKLTDEKKRGSDKSTHNQTSSAKAAGSTGAAYGIGSGTSHGKDTDSFGHGRTSSSTYDKSASRGNDKSSHNMSYPSGASSETRGDAYGHGERSLSDAVVDPSRNRNPIAEGVASSSLDKPAETLRDQTMFESNTGDKLRGSKRGDVSKTATIPGVSNASNYVSKASGGDSLPGTFPGGSSKLSQSPLQGGSDATYSEGYSNYTASGTRGNSDVGGSADPRTYKDDDLADLEAKQKEREQPGLIQQIVDTAKSVI